MGNNKSTTPIFLAVPFMLFLSAVLSGTSISADESSGKKEVKQQKNPYANAAAAPFGRQRMRRPNNHSPD